MLAGSLQTKSFFPVPQGTLSRAARRTLPRLQAYPPVREANIYTKEKIMRIIFCGDLCPTETTRPAFDRGDLAALMGDVPKVLAGADYAVANLECALTENDTPIRKIGSLQKGLPADARLIAECGFTHMGLSNNHTLDYGVAGMRDTVEAVRAAGMVPFGFGENDRDSRQTLYLQKGGVKVAVVAVCEHEYTYALPDQFGANPFDPFDTMEDIAEAKKNADFVVVMYHGGKEQCEYPSPRLRRACRAMVRAGADLVLTQHSHCIGSRETYENAEILYGQGNFNFVEEPENPQWQTGLIADVTFDGALRVTYIPVVVTDTGVRLASPAEKKTCWTPSRGAAGSCGTTRRGCVRGRRSAGRCRITWTR